MNIHEETHGAVTVIKPVGAVTFEEADVFRERLNETRARTMGRLVIDVSAMPFIDSAGLETLTDCSNALARGGQSLKLCNVTETLREVLDLTELMDTFEQYDDVNAAVRSFL